MRMCPREESRFFVLHQLIADAYPQIPSFLLAKCRFICFFAKIIWLFEGSSTCLYGTNLNPLVDDGMGNIEELRGKSMIIFACKSAEFIKRYHFPKSLGFGFVPTSLDDARDGVLHNMNLRELNSVGLEMFKKAIVRIWHRTLKEVTFEQMERIPDLFSFYTNHEIVNTLLHHKDYQYYRIVADMLYYLKDDMRFIF